MSKHAFVGGGEVATNNSPGIGFSTATCELFEIEWEAFALSRDLFKQFKDFTLVESDCLKDAYR